MSPEQAAGLPVDARSDLYSLGIILDEMLTGEVPFTAPNTLALPAKHMQEVPVAPSQRRPDLGISPAVETVVLRCLEKDPARRYQSADDVVAALDGIAAAARPVTSAAESAGAAR